MGDIKCFFPEPIFLLGPTFRRKLLSYKQLSFVSCIVIFFVFSPFFSSNLCLFQEECQLGRTKLFVRQPETFFELEKLRVKMVGNLVASIQRGWRRFRDRRKFVLMQQVPFRTKNTHSKRSADYKVLLIVVVYQHSSVLTFSRT